MLCAVDAGYRNTKVVADGSRFVFPSVLGTPRVRTLIPEHAGPYDELHVAVNGKEYFVGSLALRESHDAGYTLDVEKIHTTRPLILVATAIAAGCEDRTVDLITGLPIAHYRLQREALAEALRGRHEVRFLAGRHAGRKCLLDIRKVLIFPQGAGALFSRVLAPDGRPLDSEFSRGLHAVGDIGYKTTDTATFQNLEFVDQASGSFPVGISDAHAALVKRLNEQGKEVLMTDAEDYIEAGEPELRATAAKITSNIRALVGPNAKLVFAGGGALALKRYLPGPVLPEAEYANAAGFYRIARGKLGA